jgi:LmbE family N-acetylglucosaminyl deacetylase
LKSVIVIAPHPDDETLGCGGTLLRHKAEGDKVHWLIITGISEKLGFSADRVSSRKAEIDKVSESYGFDSVHSLSFPAAGLDQIPLNEIVEAISSVFKEIRPNIVYLPHRGDVHTDHGVVFDSAAACTKWFRYGHVNRVLAYETLSETGFGIDPNTRGFEPNVYVNIEPYLERKLEIFEIYEGEGGVFPFPRSEKTIRALSSLRGSSAGFISAEAFMLLREAV